MPIPFMQSRDRSPLSAPHAAGSHMGRAPKLRNASSASVNATPVFAVALDMCGVGTDCLLAPPPHRAGCSLTLPVLVNLGHGEEGEGSEDDEKEEEEYEEEEEDDDARPQSEKNNRNTRSISSGPRVSIATPISIQVTVLQAFTRSSNESLVLTLSLEFV